MEKLDDNLSARETDTDNSKKRRRRSKLSCKNGVSVRADIDFALDEEPSKLYPLIQYLIAVMAAVSSVFMFKGYLSYGGYYEPKEMASVIWTVLLTAGACLMVHRGSAFFKVIGAIYMVMSTGYILLSGREIAKGFDHTWKVYECYYDLTVNGNEGAFARFEVAEGVSDALTTMLVAAAFMLTMLIAISCIYYTNFPIFFFSTFPVFELGVIWGWEPITWTFVVMAACWIASLALTLINHTASKKSAENNFAVSMRRRSFYLTSFDVKQRFFTSHAVATFLTAAIVLTAIMPAAVMLNSKRTREMHELRAKISRNFKEITDDLSEGKLPTIRTIPGRGRPIGGTNGGQLDNSGIDFTGDTMLRLETAEFSRPLYLRGYAGEEYLPDQSCWDPIEVDENAQRIFADNDRTVLDYTYLVSKLFSRNDMRSTRITNYATDKNLVYAPYGALYSGNENIAEQYYDGIAQPKIKGKTITLKQRSSVIGGLTWDSVLDSAEKADTERAINSYGGSYYDAVMKNEIYFDLISEEMRTTLDGIIEEAGVKYTDPISVKLQKLRFWFGENGFTYTTDPSAANEDLGDREFVEFFLTKQKEGYCIHYASAAVLLMRALGYPARYVEGYIVEPSQFVGADMPINVSDHCAHAWCEIFINGCGWYPVELTPGYEDFDNPNLTDEERGISPDEEDSSGIEDTSSAKESEPDELELTESKPDESSSTSDSSDTSSVTESTETSETDDSENSASETEGSETDSDSEAAQAAAVQSDTSGGDGDGGVGEGSGGISREQLMYTLMTCLFILGFAAAIVLRRRKVLGDIETGVNDKSGSRSAVFCYTSLLKYISLLGIENDRRLTDVQLSAKVRSELTEYPELNDAFVHISETAITAYMSGADTDEQTAARSRTLFRSAREMIYENLSTFRRLTARWIYGLY